MSDQRRLKSDITNYELRQQMVFNMYFKALTWADIF